MADWNPDKTFLNFLVLRLERSGIPMNREVTKLEDKQYSYTDVIDEMKQGTPVGRIVYHILYAVCKEDYFRSPDELAPAIGRLLPMDKKDE